MSVTAAGRTVSLIIGAVRNGDHQFCAISYESNRESGIAHSLPPRFESGRAVVGKYCGYAMGCCGNKCPQPG